VSIFDEVEKVSVVGVVVGDDEANASNSCGKLAMVVDAMTEEDVAETSDESTESVEEAEDVAVAVLEARAESIICMASESDRAVEVASVDEASVDEAVVAEIIEVEVAGDDEDNASSN